MNSTTIAVDVAKAVFEVAVSEHAGPVRERQRFSRKRFRRYLGEPPPATILMEACGSAHDWGREAPTRGHRVLLLPLHAVRPYVVCNKTDRTDAKGLLEAARNDEVRPGPVTSETPQALAALQRLRSTCLATRTARINTVRGLLREFGVVIPTGACHVVPALGAVLDDADAGVPRLLRPALAEASRDIREIEGRIRAVEPQLDAVGEQTPVVSRLRSIPGVGLVTATALVAAVGDVQRVPWARHFASSLGLTPRERSTGQRRQLGAISKRGDADLRMLVIHGARAVLCHAKTTTAPTPDRVRAWALHLERVRGHTNAAVALTNKLARMAWAGWKYDSDFAVVPAA